MVADVPVGVLLSGGIDSSLVVALLAEAGQHDLQTFSIGFESAGGESGDEFEYSSLVAEHFGTDHHRIEIDSSRLLPGIDAAIARDERADGQPRLRGVLPAQPRTCRSSVKVVQSGQGADEVLGGYDWYPPLAEVPRDEAVEAYANVFFDRRWAALGELLNPDWLLDHDAPMAFITEQFGRPGAETVGGRRAAQRHHGHAGRRPGEAGRQHDDGLGAGGPGAVPRPRVRRAGRPDPARAQAGRRRQGRAQAGRAAGWCPTR